MASKTVAGQAARERAAKVAVARGRAARGIRFDYEAAAALGMSKSAYARYAAQSYQNMTLRDAAMMAKAFGFTAREWCEMAGIRYE